MSDLAQLEADLAHAEHEREAALVAWRAAGRAYFDADMRLLRARLNLDDYTKENAS